MGLRDITEAGFVELSRPSVRKILSRTYAEEPFQREEQIKNDLLSSRTDPEKGGRPSVESSLHEMLDWKYVVHTHPFEINALMCARDAEKEVQGLFGDAALLVPYTDPGYRLAKLMWDELSRYKKSHGAHPHVVLMRNHGLVVAANTTAEIRSLTEEVFSKIRGKFRRPLAGEPLPVADAVARVVPALRMLLSEGETAKVAGVRNSTVVQHFLRPENREKISLPFMPDDIVYCKSAPLFLDFKKDPEEALAAFPSGLAEYKKRWGYPPKMLMISAVGLVAVEDSARSVENLPGRVRGPHESELAFGKLRRPEVPHAQGHPVHRHVGGGELSPQGCKKRLHPAARGRAGGPDYRRSPGVRQGDC